jgi:inner membrane protein
MDSITQAALGAAVGHAALGRRVGGRAAAWGAALGTLPDLDILAYPLLDEAGQLLFHRGPTHALLFSGVASPLIGLALSRLHGKSGEGWKRWAWLSFLALATHAFLDACTAYGTQLLLPFSRIPVAFSNIAIVDPLYTTPLIVGMLVQLIRRRDDRLKRWANAAGLLLSTVYLMATGLNKLVVYNEYQRQLADQGVVYERLETAPLPLTNLLWIGLAVSESTVWAGVYSVFDSKPIAFKEIPRRDELLTDRSKGSSFETLLWFSRGFYRLVPDEEGLRFDDLHVGRTDFWLSDDGTSIFSYRLDVDDRGRVTTIASVPAHFPSEGNIAGRFFQRAMRGFAAP